ncbi:MAG: WD40 repeat domain-containing protein [Patescibacteria group bacterium]|nr:WD40 repeat domain-containing protein [Patescibacteria group bacterium]
MKKILILFCALVAIFWAIPVIPDAKAEDLPSGVIPKLPKTANDPILSEGKIYPFWGPVCQRYTYSVIYSDKEGRTPEYVKIYFNGKMIDMEKADANDNNYKKGVKYIYKNVPNKFGSNFYYFEASNGLGKTRDSIIDSPDNGPVLFDADFKENEIILIDPESGNLKWRYPIQEEWVGGVALSDDGRYLAAQTSNHIYFFDTEKSEPSWSYQSPTGGAIGGDVKGGVAISARGDKIFAALNGKALMFDQNSNQPIWTYNLGNNGGGAYGVDIAKNGAYAAVAMAGSEEDLNSNVLILFDAKDKKLWQYHSAGNWHEVNLSQDGSYIAGSTGCPDRRGYLFTKDSAEPIIKSEPLSKESPIDETRISADGSLIAFGVESGYGAIVLMDAQKKEILWKYETSQGTSVRALAMAPSGNLIGAGTFGGDILIFEKNSNKPIEKLKINSTIGAFDITDDGLLFATGSADKKIRVFEKGAGKAKAEISANEYVGELDIAANGKYLAAGTSGAVYFFETIRDLENKGVFACKEIIEPKAEDTTLFGGQNSGNNLADSADNQEKPVKKETSSWLTRGAIIFGGILIIALFGYILICRKRARPPKKLIIILISFSIILALIVVFYFGQWKNVESDKSLDQGQIKKEGQENICGNTLCEPNLGETKENCAKDCLGGE